MKLSEYPWKGLVCRWKSDTFNYFFCILKTTQLSGLDCYQSIGFYLKKHRLMFLEKNWIKCHLMLSPESLNGKTHQAFCIFKYSHRDCFIQLKFILLIIKHLKEHRTKCNLKQHGRIRVHRHSYKLNAASKIVSDGGSRALNQQPILSQVIQLWSGGPTTVLLRKALNPRRGRRGAFRKTKTTHRSKCPQLWLWCSSVIGWNRTYLQQHACCRVCSDLD